MIKENLEAASPDLSAQLDRLNKNLERDIAARESWKLALRNGFIAAVGGAIGTTIVLTIVVRVLQPYIHLATIRPSIERQAPEPQAPEPEK
jgi:hypothetical protein